MIYKNKVFYSLRESPHYQKLKNRELGDIQNLEPFFSKKDIHNLCQKTIFCNSTVTIHRLFKKKTQSFFGNIKDLLHPEYQFCSEA
jgi:hypothetical protein